MAPKIKVPATLRHWWSALPAVPADPDSSAYRRLARIFRDPTRIGRKASAIDGYRGHEFLKPTHETNLTCTLFENFSLFAAEDWLPDFLWSAGLDLGDAKIRDCEWSYEWEARVEGKKRPVLCDVVIHYRTTDGREGVAIVECKNLGKKPGKKDLDPAYYLRLRELAGFDLEPVLIYCIDEARVDWTRKRMAPETGLLTWQTLGGLQISLARQLDLPSAARNFIAGAIQYQFCQHGIQPEVPSADYLANEDEMSAENLLGAGKQTTAEREEVLWRRAGEERTTKEPGPRPEEDLRGA